MAITFTSAGGNLLVQKDGFTISTLPISATAVHKTVETIRFVTVTGTLLVQESELDANEYADIDEAFDAINTIIENAPINSKGYYEMWLKVNQSTSSNPTYTILKDDTGEGLSSFTRTADGTYIGVPATSGSFIAVNATQGSQDPSAFIQGFQSAAGQFTIQTSTGGALVDNVLIDAPIQILIFF